MRPDHEQIGAFSPSGTGQRLVLEAGQEKTFCLDVRLASPGDQDAEPFLGRGPYSGLDLSPNSWQKAALDIQDSDGWNRVRDEKACAILAAERQRDLERGS